MKKRPIGFRRKHVRKVFKGMALLVTQEMRALERQGYTQVSVGFGDWKMSLYMEKDCEYFTRELGPLEYKGPEKGFEKCSAK